MKKDLSMIMNEFAALEYDMRAMASVLSVLEEYYDVNEQKKLNMNICVIKRLLDSLIVEMSETISKLDTYMN